MIPFAKRPTLRKSTIEMEPEPTLSKDFLQQPIEVPIAVSLNIQHIIPSLQVQHRTNTFPMEIGHRTPDHERIMIEQTPIMTCRGNPRNKTKTTTSRYQKRQLLIKARKLTVTKKARSQQRMKPSKSPRWFLPRQQRDLDSFEDVVFATNQTINLNIRLGLT